jgi:hypothetical protein
VDGRRGRLGTVCARVACPAWSSGPSTSPLDNMQNRQQYDLAFSLVRESVAQWDPLGLVGGGAPADEWDHEVARIVARLRDARTPHHVGAAVAEVFSDALGSSGPDAASCEEFGRALYSRLKVAGII